MSVTGSVTAQRRVSLGSPSMPPLLPTLTFNSQKWENWKTKVLCAALIENSFSEYVLWHKYLLLFIITVLPFSSPATLTHSWWPWQNIFSPVAVAWWLSQGTSRKLQIKWSQNPLKTACRTLFYHTLTCVPRMSCRQISTRMSCRQISCLWAA